eukprot:1543858-Amphidinium_carterae.1
MASESWQLQGVVDLLQRLQGVADLLLQRVSSCCVLLLHLLLDPRKHPKQLEVASSCTSICGWVGAEGCPMLPLAVYPCTSFA